jgi:DNA-binding LacI/PurR family transcriptional regulator
MLTDYCEGLQPGDFVPSHHELAQTFGVSTRSVRWALDELRRQGRIVRRQGARTQIAGTVACSDNRSHGSVQEPAPPSEAETRVVVAVAVPDRALFDQAMQFLVEQAKAEGVSVFCHLSPGGAAEKQIESLLPLLSRKPLGFIVFRRELIPLAEFLRAEGHPVVVIGTPYANALTTVPLVYGNHKYGGYLATKHLIDLGHRHIGCCAYGDWPGTLRAQGHRRAIQEAARSGIQVRDVDVNVCSLASDPNYADRVFTGPDVPTALVVWNDHEAVAVLGHLNRLGIRVPQDISVVGYDNLPEGQMLHPPLTTVFSPMEPQLDAALDLLTNPADLLIPQRVIVQPMLIQRGSSAPPRAEIDTRLS